MSASPERLHITNGDAAAERILAAGVGGSVLPWRDVLHEGPVPAGLPLDELTAVRAEFIGGAGWQDQEQALAGLRWRDAMLAGFRAYAEVVLWFEHDLYDQLQLLQALDWFGATDLGPVRLSLINPAEFLGMQSAERIRDLFAARRAVTTDALDLAAAVWAEFRSPDPTALALRAGDPTRALPHLSSALTRLLEEYPGAADGLSRSERQILHALADGPLTIPRLFRAAHVEREDAEFLGDLVFGWQVERLAAATVPPLRYREPEQQEVELTLAGGDALAGRFDHVEVNGVDRWIGGVHLEGRRVPWRWSRERARLEASG
ncbi:MAG TPA: hypothetical protein PKA66_05750 [Gemmatimonadales bacterium]|nr:hypothetical protein [Gemmatimonadales bacterium]